MLTAKSPKTAPKCRINENSTRTNQIDGRQSYLWAWHTQLRYSDRQQQNKANQQPHQINH